MSTLTENKRVGDVVQWEVDPRYTRISARFENDTGSAAAFEKGTVLEFDTDHYQPADGTSFGGILLEDIAELANGAGVNNVAMLVRGPALVNADQLEWDGGATQASVIAAALTAGVRLVQESDNTETAGE